MLHVLKLPYEQFKSVLTEILDPEKNKKAPGPLRGGRGGVDEIRLAEMQEHSEKMARWKKTVVKVLGDRRFW